MPNANSFVAVLPRTMPPAARTRATTAASVSGTRTQPSLPPVVGNPAASTMSFTATGAPSSAPRSPAFAQRVDLPRLAARVPRVERQPRPQVVALDRRERPVDRLDGGQPSRRELIQHEAGR